MCIRDRAYALRKGPGTLKTVYQAMEMPIVLSDRDIIYTFDYTYTEDSVTIVGRTLPKSKGPRTIGERMHLTEGRWFLKKKGSNQTHLVLEILIDPKGSLPSWFVNLIQRDYPVGLLNKLSVQARRANVKPLTMTTGPLTMGESSQK